MCLRVSRKNCRLMADERQDGVTPVRCVDCYLERELIRTAAFVYDGRSVCSRHLHLAMADNLEA